MVGPHSEGVCNLHTLYGKKLEHRDIVTKGVRAPAAAARLLSLLNRYSAKEGTH